MNDNPMIPEQNEDGELSPTLQEESPSPQKEAPAKKASNGIFDFLEMLAWSLLAVFLLFTFVLRLCRVEGHSMENTLRDGENILIYSLFYTPKQDDIIVFHLTQPEDGLEKTVVKRVIATEGQYVEIHTQTNEIFVDGVKYEDSHAVLKDRISDFPVGKYDTNLFEHHYSHMSGVFSATVPEGHVFVLGDNRNNSKDSRDIDMGFIDERCILGKAILRLSPFTVFSE